MTLRFYYDIDSYKEIPPRASRETYNTYYAYNDSPNDYPNDDINYAIHESSDLVSHLMDKGLYPVKVEIV